ncbi:MAG: ATP-binding cassette domain-containing protein [Treponema sp.]|jgi:ABC-type multidrug transport system ATPase subunit|nr:ATP-binding cassette domain-containing protein [Treponema sp.]
MAEPIIEMKDVSFSAQGERIVGKVSLRVEQGKTVALAGPSGGGKSTALKLAAGILVPSGGNVFYRGKNIDSMNRLQNLAFRREAAVVFQDSALWANQNLNQILELPLRVHFPDMGSGKRRERIREAMELVGYRRDLEVRPAMLSMGEQKLIAFARAMLCCPELLFLDEWTESLDDSAAQRLIGIVRRFKDEGKTIIFVSHNFPLIQRLADCVIMIAKGQIVRRLEGGEIAGDQDLAEMSGRELGLCGSEYALPIR